MSYGHEDPIAEDMYRMDLDERFAALERRLAALEQAREQDEDYAREQRDRA